MLKKGVCCIMAILLILTASACNPDIEEDGGTESVQSSSIPSPSPAPDKREESERPESESRAGGFTYDDLPDTMKNNAPFGETRIERNHLWREDLTGIGEKLPEMHSDLFRNITEEEFRQRLDELIESVGQLSDEEIEVKLGQLLVSVGDADTYFVSHEETYFPLQLRSFDGLIYVVAAGGPYQDMIYGQLMAVDGMDIPDVVKELQTLIPVGDDMYGDIGCWMLFGAPDSFTALVY